MVFEAWTRDLVLENRELVELLGVCEMKAASPDLVPPANAGRLLAAGCEVFVEGLIDPHRTIQIGIRSPMHREIFDWTTGKGVTIVSAEDVHETGPRAVAERIRAVVGDMPCYLSFDVDALDPAFAPGTATPEVGGLAIADDMMQPPLSVSESDDLHAALEAILRHGVRELLVVDHEGRIVGFLDEADITRVYHGATAPRAD